MEVEEEFLENASTMVHYAKREIEQFLAWTDKQAAYGQKATAIEAQLADIALAIRALKKEYKER